MQTRTMNELRWLCDLLKKLAPAGWTLACEDEDYRVYDSAKKEIGFFFGFEPAALFFLESAKLLPSLHEILEQFRKENQRLRGERNLWKHRYQRLHIGSQPARNLNN